MSKSESAARTYNQNHIPRKYGAGRRVSIYWTWSYPWEANRDVTEMDNRFSTMTEVRRVAWPSYETLDYSEKMFLQGIAGTLELFHLSTLKFQHLVEEVTGQPVAVYQRIDQAGQRAPLDERILADTDTMMVFGLDHMVTEQEAAEDEIEAFKYLRGICKVVLKLRASQLISSAARHQLRLLVGICDDAVRVNDKDAVESRLQE